MRELLLLYLKMKHRQQVHRKLRIERFHRQQHRERVLLLILLLFAINQRNFVDRTIWTKNRSSEWWDKIAMRFTPEEWKENFRVSPEMFRYLCNELRSVLGRRDTQFSRAVSVEKRVAIALWCLSTYTDYRTIGHLFGVAKGTACVIANEVPKFGKF